MCIVMPVEASMQKYMKIHVLLRLVMKLCVSRITFLLKEIAQMISIQCYVSIDFVINGYSLILDSRTQLVMHF